ncbi:hypothetical protein A2886_01980 [candidate division WWE3 bacterium RIFCSPHIGHO2_01_FULL_42_13]|uniref:Glucose-6-phosphate isomerase n=1 Tax=candidate division WWE3 bacterium RIFCSPHIGHO2_01_FULL_42_13 TaxID=1802617 RepID=A0A1F4UQW1_UNCKA|nr:MAG: hypothetical protein A2886_01980 [candidate division WWE3 bacterium RIFCSPHIGHO2_01_FULL_42_13]
MNLLSQNSLIKKSDYDKAFEKLLPYIQTLKKVAKNAGDEISYEEHESTINLPFDEKMVREVLTVRDKMSTDRLKYFVNIGIGGSKLGAKAVYDALLGHFDVIEPDRFPKLIFLDTADSEFLYKFTNLVKQIEDPRDIVINVVTKSGTTTETLTNLEILAGIFPQINERLVITTDKDSKLWKAANEKGLVNLLEIEKNVGGRYSVFSPGGLFPLASAGIDVFELLEGAMEARQQGLETSLEKNLSAVSAISAYLNYQNGKIINDTFVFLPQLESLGKWYRQLLGESLGKDRLGITPTTSVGSSDLHSVEQLYIGGPKDKFFNFVWADPRESVKISDRPYFPLDTNLKNKTAGDIMKAIYKGVTLTYIEEGIPFVEVDLGKIGERSLGYFMQFKMIEMLFLGRLTGVNAFDQPDVESYKAKTREILSGKTSK